MATEKAGKTNIVASNSSHDTADGNDYLGQKKSKEIYLYRTKGTYCGYMGMLRKWHQTTVNLK